MDFSKYLPEHLIVKNVFTIDGTTIYKYFLVKREEIQFKAFKDKNIVSWHPLVIRDQNNFYYFKGLKKTDYILASFCMNNENIEDEFNEQVLKNYFENNSQEL